MNISQKDLRRIIVEEYIAEGALDEDNVDDLLDWIKGGKKPEWAGNQPSDPGPPPGVPSTAGDDTQVMNRPPGDDDPESEYQGFQNDSGPDIEPDLASAIGDLIQGKDPGEVAKIFDVVFAQLTGQEAPPTDEPPETLYVKGAEGRPAAGFKLEELHALIREVLSEGEWHDMGDPDKEMYNVLDPEGFEQMPDEEIIMAATDVGLDTMLILNGEGRIENREEVIAALKDVGSPDGDLDISSMSYEEKAALMADR